MSRNASFNLKSNKFTTRINELAITDKVQEILEQLVAIGLVKLERGRYIAVEQTNKELTQLLDLANAKLSKQRQEQKPIRAYKVRRRYLASSTDFACKSLPPLR